MSQALQEGAVFASRYRVLRCIAQGGMGAVYEVIHLETERRRALKVMHAHTLQSDDLRERFKREAKVAAHVESEFIVDVFDAGVDEATGMPFLVMELLRGEELGKRLKRLGRLPPGEVVAYLHQTALALDKTHRASIIHRDLKPENLFLTDREEGPPRVKVLDFGIAKIIAEGVTNGSATQSIGTPLYMSPEQFNPTAKLSGASDIYSLGMVAYALLVGSPYWSEEGRGGNVFAIAVAAIHGPKEPASVRAARKGVTLPQAFDAWFARVTAVDPLHRFTPATAAVRELALALGALQATGTLALSLADPSLEAPAASAPTPIAALASTQVAPPGAPPARANLETTATPRLMVPVGAPPPTAPFVSGAPPTPGTVLFGPAPTEVLVPPTGPEATGTTASITGRVTPAAVNQKHAPLVALGVGLTVLVAGLATFMVIRSSAAPTHAATEVSPPPAPSAAALSTGSPDTAAPMASSIAEAAVSTGAISDPPPPAPSSSAPKDATAKPPPPAGLASPAPVVTGKSTATPAAASSGAPKRKYTRD